MNRRVASAVQRYLRTGVADLDAAAWPGNFLERAQRAQSDLRGALVARVRQLAAGRPERPLPLHDTTALARRRVEPMVRGLFPRTDQELVLGVLEKSVVFLTAANIEEVLVENSWDSSAWDLANLYLASIGAELLGPEAPRIVGLSEGTTCYVSLGYFSERDPFADFIVHEAAHIFHNCKRATIGLRETRSREWLLDIEFRKRETFAYSCEAYARVLERAASPAERRELAADYQREARLPDNGVEANEVAANVVAAASVRNGWKVILARCAPRPRPKGAWWAAAAQGTTAGDLARPENPDESRRDPLP
jgi:hypothetical protein